jgi:hypothetical protein
MQCPYCDHAATTRIPAVPEHVCGTHAAEFWTGLLAFAVARPDVNAHLTTSLPMAVSGSELSAATPVADTATVVHAAVRAAVWSADSVDAVAAA